MKYLIAGVCGCLSGALLGLAVGLIGPLTFFPDSGNGPLIMFVTIPIGAILGLAAGLIIAAKK